MMIYVCLCPLDTLVGFAKNLPFKGHKHMSVTADVRLGSNMFVAHTRSLICVLCMIDRPACPCPL